MTPSCPFCKSDNTKQYLKLKDYFLTQEEFEINVCDDCNLLFTTPRPSSSEIGKYYESKNYLSHNGNNKGLIPWIYNWVKRRNIKNKFSIAFADDYVKRNKTRLLDYGCGIGDFLFFAQNKGCNVFGCDLSDDALSLASKKIGKEIVKPSVLSSVSDSNFDVITMWHVLEHIDDLQSIVSLFYRLLSENGRLVVAVPNYQSFDAQYYKDKWAAYDVPRHLNHFHKESLENVFKGKFVLKKIEPMKWDAFFISMMSEKYLPNGKPMLNGFVNGLKSNLKAKKTGEYSSLIYVFDKI